MGLENLKEEDLLSSELGMFLLELRRIKDDAKELVLTSNISDEKKQECLIIFELLERSLEKKTPGESNEPYDYYRYCILSIDRVLDQNNTEEKALFELFRSLISSALNSAKGWKESEKLKTA